MWKFYPQIVLLLALIGGPDDSPLDAPGANFEQCDIVEIVVYETKEKKN